MNFKSFTYLHGHSYKISTRRDFEEGEWKSWENSVADKKREFEKHEDDTWSGIANK